MCLPSILQNSFITNQFTMFLSNLKFMLVLKRTSTLKESSKGHQSINSQVEQQGTHRTIEQKAGNVQEGKKVKDLKKVNFKK